uniref:Uncharacterized protein n=1 Tax=Cryptomonas curvata TaxID=233186 RepID=A0A7S0QIR6_9CRYP
MVYCMNITDSLGWKTSLSGTRRVPLFQGNIISTIPYKYAARQKQAFEFGSADGQGPASRTGSHAYEINTWLWKFGRPQLRLKGLSQPFCSKTTTIKQTVQI